MKTKEQILELARKCEVGLAEIWYNEPALIRFFHAAQDDAFELAAKECDQYSGITVYDEFRAAAQQCSMVIRAMKSNSLTPPTERAE